MTDKKITELTLVSSLPDTAKIYAVDEARAVGDQSVQIDKSDLLAGSGGGTPTIQQVLTEGNEISSPNTLIFNGAFGSVSTLKQGTAGLEINGDQGVSVRNALLSNDIKFTPNDEGIYAVQSYDAYTTGVPATDRLIYTQRGYVDDAVSGITTPTEEEVIGTALENATMTGTVNLDLSTFSYFKGILTGVTTITVTNTPAVNKSFVRNAKINSATTESITLPVTWDVIGSYVADGTDNYFTIIFSNLTTTGENVTCYINQI